MKYLFLKMVFILLSATQFYGFAQQKDSVSEPVKNYWNLMDNFSLRYRNKNEISKTYSGDEIDTLTKKYFKAITEDPIGVKIKRDKDFQKWSSSGNPKEIKPAVKLRMMREIIANKYGTNFAEIISVPYYLKVKIVGDSGSVYISPENNRELRVGQANYFGIIEDVIKGNNFFKVNQKITISFLSFWVAESKRTFEVGKSYFIPLTPWDSYHNYSKLTIDILPDNNFANYPIQNGEISTPGNFFGIGSSTNWETFRNYFINKFILKWR